MALPTPPSGRAPVVVPAIPPRRPVLNLVDIAIEAGTQSDPSEATPIPPEQLAELPAELRAELAEREGDTWVRGIWYAPENHGPAWLRDPSDYSTVDLPALSAPHGLALRGIATGTLVPATTYSYQVTAINADGETTPCAIVTLVLGGGDGSIVLTWDEEADGIQYKVYGRIGGSIGLLAVVGPFAEGEQPTWTDTGAGSPGAAPPVSNTTGGPGDYTNAPVVMWIPPLIVTMDQCSSWGWSERDFVGRAKRWCDNATPAAVEGEFWAGLLTQAKSYGNNWLTNEASVTDITPGTVPSLVRGLNILQDALAQCGFGGQGMIHVQAQTTPSLVNARRIGKLLLDTSDNFIVPGVGYPNLGPGNIAPSAGYAWMYATDLVVVRTEDEPTVFPDTFAEALDRGQAGEPNTIAFRAQRFGGAYWDASCHFGCKVALPS